MSINHLHPSYVEFIQREFKTLEFLFNSPFISNDFPDLALSARRFYDKYRVAKTAHFKNSSLQFETNFIITVEGRLARVVIESTVNANFSLVSYVLSICNPHDNPTDILRKFHFDYALPNKNEESKPIYHLQYSGKQSPGLLALNIDLAGIHPWLSSPRIIYSPINLALLLDLVFVEFKSEHTKKIIDRPEWSEFIKANEAFLLVPYYKNINQFISNKHNADSLIRDFCYG